MYSKNGIRLTTKKSLHCTCTTRAHTSSVGTVNNPKNNNNWGRHKLWYNSAGNNFSLFTGHMSFQIFLLVGHLPNWTGHNLLTDNTLKKRTQDLMVRCSVIVSDHNVKLAGHFQNLVGQCPMTDCYFQHCIMYNLLHTIFIHINGIWPSWLCLRIWVNFSWPKFPWVISFIFFSFFSLRLISGKRKRKRNTKIIQ